MVPDDLVQRFHIGTFHNDCLACSICNIHIEKGEKFQFTDGTILCKLHFFDTGLNGKKYYIPVDAILARSVILYRRSLEISFFNLIYCKQAPQSFFVYISYRYLKTLIV